MNTFPQYNNPSNYQFIFQFTHKVKCVGLALLLMSVTGCSVVDSFQSPQSQARALPKIPEVKRQQVNNPRYTQPKKVTRVQKAPVAKVVKPQAKVITAEERMQAKELLQKQAKEQATVDIDPYATVPESNSLSITSTVENPSPEKEEAADTSSSSSPAVKSLMIGARADLAIGKNSSAVSKLERGLRIESQNPELWHLLSKAHYSDNDYTQAITMAKKSNRYSNDDNLIAQNWALIKKAGEKSGNATAIKEALDYIKLNP
ncbi:hypothetical protein OO007_17860 [Cocleimonas sp. KMM 6892]|uniref:tetratricopeptide repeat protein n=1 Tax=unclassified Cocleimonas TaxID=2639732 RepID=UPI002DBFDA30|nr:MULTISPECIES: hypothetical protein [unclassified Cocleimonas]MEB8434110.1 hypothetical protein [Cocleimonas sp. KMM 6892]MEC4717030.1 hypothetical protein [Cocleimonas sp. KMM 6895]MEC4746382.1 hypothetical protein [Cocleimonas sp. KMM 6896]